MIDLSFLFFLLLFLVVGSVRGIMWQHEYFLGGLKNHQNLCAKFLFRFSWINVLINEFWVKLNLIFLSARELKSLRNLSIKLSLEYIFFRIHSERDSLSFVYFSHTNKQDFLVQKVIKRYIDLQPKSWRKYEWMN